MAPKVVFWSPDRKKPNETAARRPRVGPGSVGFRSWQNASISLVHAMLVDAKPVSHADGHCCSGAHLGADKHLSFQKKVETTSRSVRSCWSGLASCCCGMNFRSVASAVETVFCASQVRRHELVAAVRHGSYYSCTGAYRI